MKKINEVKVSPEHKKQFLKDALVILDNMEKANLVDKDTDFKTVNNTLRMVFAKIAGGKDSYNNRLFHKILPKKLNTDLYDNGDGNTYDSVWMSQNDAQRDTILKKAIKAKLNISEADVDESSAKGKSEFKEFQSLYFDMHSAIRKVSKNNKLKGYAGEVTHEVCDLLYFVEQDRLAIGDLFNALRNLRKKAKD